METMARECEGGGDLPEEYAVGVEMTKVFFDEQVAQSRPTPSGNESRPTPSGTKVGRHFYPPNERAKPSEKKCTRPKKTDALSRIRLLCRRGRVPPELSLRAPPHGHGVQRRARGARRLARRALRHGPLLLRLRRAGVSRVHCARVGGDALRCCAAECG